MTFDSLNHKQYLQLALDEACKSPPKPTNFCVGAALVSPSRNTRVLVTGYTLECPGNTHAEQSCFIKYAQSNGCGEDDLGDHLPTDTILYTTMEPCNKRSKGHAPCVDRILDLKRSDGSQAIKIVVVGVAEPETFVGVNDGKKKLQDAGIHVVHIPGLEEQILATATAGHTNGKEPAHHKRNESKNDIDNGVVGMNWNLSKVPSNVSKSKWGSGSTYTE
ncbi:Bifunctional protein RIB2 [Fulvia fulva]|uniref:Bifunctional protein RIB2 n=1 Tax=Passalora fulva TaxID=5499 RepID=A0A9Q8P9D4_PASFU|nr:Bifunctional protein RIB2 [Fulvia fulva]KAK4624016.1 Bifunctional protein RIB2 [Fulvia fulva]KAK4625824.1 Bifunctional protein RIB2 [Fulvia fulva]UJO17942.1 Bifunctional protein RIB2 [Fulvia fulva]WPV14693.1 Bifunctional protein RIB2 [Fulvia fulva]WPV30017.1 Bifunctional protein RIB2 [Fulvia fulva]